MKQHSKCCNAETTFQHGVYFCNHCISICQVRKKPTIILAILFTFCLLLASDTTSEHRTVVSYKPVIPSDFIPSDSVLTRELLKRKCILPNVAIAQFKWESSMAYNSNVAKTCNNLAGIKFMIRGSKGIGYDDNHYVKYKNYSDFLDDYVRIQNGYLAKIDGKYAEDSLYIKKLKSTK